MTEKNVLKDKEMRSQLFYLSRAIIKNDQALVIENIRILKSRLRTTDPYGLVAVLLLFENGLKQGKEINLLSLLKATQRNIIHSLMSDRESLASIEAKALVLFANILVHYSERPDLTINQVLKADEKNWDLAGTKAGILSTQGRILS